MSDDKYLGIAFPFQEDLKGKYLKLNKTPKDETKSNLTHLLTTTKGERLYRPDFGTNIMQYLFEPIDEKTYNDIRTEIIGAITKYMKEIEVKNIEINVDESQNFIGIKIAYSISDGFFKESDNIELLF